MGGGGVRFDHSANLQGFFRAVEKSTQQAEGAKLPKVPIESLTGGVVVQGTSADARVPGQVRIAQAPPERSVQSQQQASTERLQAGGFWKQWGKGVGGGLWHIAKGLVCIPGKAVLYAAQSAKANWTANTGAKAFFKAAGFGLLSALTGALSGAAEVVGGVVQTAATLIPIAAIRDAFSKTLARSIGAENKIRDELGKPMAGAMIDQKIQGSDTTVLDAMVEYASKTNNKISKEKIAMYINIGERLAQTLNDESTKIQPGVPLFVDGVHVTANETSITALSWFVASQTVKEHGLESGTFESGAYVFQDTKNGNFAEFMKSGMTARASSHCKAYAGDKPKQVGLDAGRRELPGKGGALLMAPLPAVNGQPRMCFMKFEETGVPNPVSKNSQNSVEQGTLGSLEARLQAGATALHHAHNFFASAVKPENSKLDKCTKGSLGPATKQYRAALEQLAAASEGGTQTLAKQLGAGIEKGKIGFAGMVNAHRDLVASVGAGGTDAQQAALGKLDQAVQQLRAGVQAYQSKDPAIEAGRMAAEIRLGKLGA